MREPRPPEETMSITAQQAQTVLAEADRLHAPDDVNAALDRMAEADHPGGPSSGTDQPLRIV